jgi:glyoxylase-like metal-dependent hydrolase (beta-lactamase superfamily II)
MTTRRPSEVAERVYRLGTRWINFYLVEDQGEFTLIDAGYPSYWEHLVEAIDALGTSLGAIRAVILTHHHADHVGAARRLNSSTGAPVLVGAGRRLDRQRPVSVPREPGLLPTVLVAAQRAALPGPQRRGGRRQVPTGQERAGPGGRSNARRARTPSRDRHAGPHRRP